MAERLGPVERTKRHPVSCIPCRQRKVKCDRNQPCEMCVQKGRSPDCVYTPKSSRRPRQHHHHVQDRVRHLESVIESLVERQEQAQLPCTSSPVGEVQSSEGSVGRIRTQNGETHYVGGEHWSVIAGDIPCAQEMRRPVLQQSQSDMSPDLLLGTHSGLTREELLHSVPSRAIADRLISRYFNTMDYFALITHAPTFEKEYNSFWEDPSIVSLNWLSMLYSMMCVASCHLTLSRDPKDGTSQLRQDISFFRRMSAHCLILSDYTKPTVNTVEALVLYLFGRLMERQASEENQFANYLVLTTIVRVAMRAGYHRDSLHFPEISAFAGEYRRRVWLMILQFDILMSFEMGLHRMINDVETDTEIPRILRDGNLSPDMRQLPASQYGDNNILRYMIVRKGILMVLGKIQDRVVSIHPLSHETVGQLDNYLDEQYNSVPSSLRAHHRYSITETPNDLLQRLMLDILFQKARCSLHRRFMNTQPMSHDRCINASLRIISHQAYMYHESRPGGFLCGYKWKIMCAATYDFLLATIIICLAVYPKTGSGPAITPGVDTDAYEGRRDLLKALEDSYNIWTEWSTETHKAGVVFDIVKSVLRKVQGQRNAAPLDHNHHLKSVESPYTEPPNTEHTADATCPSNSSATANNDFPLQFNTDIENMSPLSTDIFANIVDLEGGIDWAQWDNQMQQCGISPHLRPNSQLWFNNQA